MTATIGFDKLSDKGKKSALNSGYSEGESVSIIINESASNTSVHLINKNKKGNGHTSSAKPLAKNSGKKATDASKKSREKGDLQEKGRIK